MKTQKPNAKRKTRRQVRAVVRLAGHVLPKFCEFGGLMEYDVSFGRVWSVCTKCTPVETVTIKRPAR